MSESESRAPRQSFSLVQRLSIALNIAICTFCVLSLVGMFNYLALRHAVRAHWAEDTRHELSSLTHKVLQTITNEVQVTVLFDPNETVYGQVVDLLDEYQDNCRYLKVDRVDYTRPSQAELVMRTYNIEPNMLRNMVIFDCQGRTEFVIGAQLSELDMSKLMSGESREIRRVAFKGEMLFTAALTSVSSGKKHVAYFVQGHGEPDPENTSHHAAYGEFTSLLSLNNVEARSLNIGQTGGVPADCDLLIVAGPETAMNSMELGQINSYLERGGRSLMLVPWSSKANLEPLLGAWGVKLGQNVIVDEANQRGSSISVVTSNYNHSAILKPLEGNFLQLALPRSIERVEAASQTADAPQVTEIIYTSPQAKAFGDYKIEGGALNTRPNPFKDLEGKIPMAAVVEGGVIPGVKSATRMIVVGDSLFLNNEMIIAAGNRHFAVSAVNWLLEQTHMMGGIPPKPIREYQFELTNGQLSRINYLVLGAIPGAILILALIAWLRRLR